MKTDHYEGWQRFILGVAYVLHILLVPAVVGLLINVLKIREYAKPATVHNPRHRDAAKLFQSHHKWLQNTLLISLFFMAAGYGTAYWGVGYGLGIGAAVWWLYRMVRGLVGFAANRPMPVWDDMDFPESRSDLVSRSR